MYGGWHASPLSLSFRREVLYSVSLQDGGLPLVGVGVGTFREIICWSCRPGSWELGVGVCRWRGRDVGDGEGS